MVGNEVEMLPLPTLPFSETTASWSANYIWAFVLEGSRAGFWSQEIAGDRCLAAVIRVEHEALRRSIRGLG